MYPARSDFFYCHGALPPAAAYFFSHYSLFERFSDERQVKRARSVVFFTHPSHPALDSPRGAAVLARASVVVSMSTMFAEALRRTGVPAERLRVIVPGVDPARFQPHKRDTGAVGFSSAYYERKSPELIVQIASLRPHVRFLLLGREWRTAPVFHQLADQPNLEYLEWDLNRYPEFYRSIDVFISPSKLEGGPIPLLEAMMSNVVPIATRTGFASDIITHGANGFLLDIDSTAGSFVALLDIALTLTVDVRSSVVHLTTDAFARAVIDLL